MRTHQRRTDDALMLSDSFADLPVDVCLHAVDVDTGSQIGHQADAPVVPASVFKISVLLELFRCADAGELDITTPVPVPVEGRAEGPFGFSVMRDPATMSLRDLAWQMIGISDNAATDLICKHVGLDNVNATLSRLGLTQTHIGGDCRDLFRTMIEDAGIDRVDDFPTYPDEELLVKL